MSNLLEDLLVTSAESCLLLFQDFRVRHVHSVDDITEFVQPTTWRHVDELATESFCADAENEGKDLTLNLKREDGRA